MINPLASRKHMQEVQSSTGGMVTTSLQALKSNLSSPRNHLILCNIDANSRPSCAQTSNLSPQSRLSTSNLTSSGNDRDSAMFIYDHLSKPSIEQPASALSELEEETATIICSTRLNPQLFIPPSIPNEIPFEDHEQEPRIVAATSTNHNGSSSAKPGGTHHPHLETIASPSESESVTLTRQHSNLHTQLAELHRVRSTTPSDSLAADAAKNAPITRNQILSGSDPLSEIQRASESRAHKAPDMLSLRNGKKLVVATSVRRSARVHREDYLPLGPRHLELEYHEAWEELRYATLKAVFSLGYDSKRVRTGRSVRRTVPPTVQDIMRMNIPSVVQARRRVDEADRRLNDALSKGFTWENTPLPKYKVVEDERGNILHVALIEDPLASDPPDSQIKQRGSKRKCERDLQLHPGDQAKRRCKRPSSD